MHVICIVHFYHLFVMESKTGSKKEVHLVKDLYRGQLADSKHVKKQVVAIHCHCASDNYGVSSL